MTIAQFLRRADTIGPEYPADFRRLVGEAATTLRAMQQRPLPRFERGDYPTQGTEGFRAWKARKGLEEAAFAAAVAEARRAEVRAFVTRTVAWIATWGCGPAFLA